MNCIAWMFIVPRHQHYTTQHLGVCIKHDNPSTGCTAYTPLTVRVSRNAKTWLYISGLIFTQSHFPSVFTESDLTQKLWIWHFFWSKEREWGMKKIKNEQKSLKSVHVNITLPLSQIMRRIQFTLVWQSRVRSITPDEENNCVSSTTKIIWIKDGFHIRPFLIQAEESVQWIEK